MWFFPQLRYCCPLSVSELVCTADCRCGCSRSQLHPASTGKNSSGAAGAGRNTGTEVSSSVSPLLLHGWGAELARVHWCCSPGVHADPGEGRTVRETGRDLSLLFQ